MVSAKVYVEGGGRGTKALRTECRQAFKGVHSFAILRELDAGKVCAASPHAERLIDALRANKS